VAAAVRYQSCSDVKCLPPVKKTATAQFTFVAGAPAQNVAIPAGYALVGTAAAAPPSAGPAKAATAAQQDWLPFLLTAFGFGLASLFTPCVFPMIPITVSFFLNEHAGAWKQALVFCLASSCCSPAWASLSPF